MQRNQSSPLWPITAAGAFNEAITLAAKAEHRATSRYAGKHAGDHHTAASPTVPLALRATAIAIGLLVVSGIAIAGWVA